MVSAAASLFIVGSAAAVYEVKVNLNVLGGGTGKVTFSATSSRDFEFSGWSGESCLGRSNCVLGGLIPKTSKTVIAVFNAPICTEFTYSEFGACQLDGTRRRTVASAGPIGCIGGDPATSQQCWYDPCARAQTTEVQDRSLWERFGDIVGSVTSGDWREAVDKGVDLAVDLFIGGEQGPPLEIPPSFPPGGGAGGPSQFNVDVSDTTVIPVGETGFGLESEFEFPPLIVTAPRDKPEPELEPIVITAPREKPEVSMDFDTNFGKDPGTFCK